MLFLEPDGILQLLHRFAKLRIVVGLGLHQGGECFGQDIQLLLGGLLGSSAGVLEQYEK